MIDRLRDVLGLPRPAPDVAKPSSDELREQRELGAENKRHINAIERHVRIVSSRVREDAEQAERRAARR